MANRWGAPVLLVGLAILAGESSALGGYFGVTNYSTNTPPTCCAQTYFVTACENSGIQTVKFELEYAQRASPKFLEADQSLLPKLVEVDSPSPAGPSPTLPRPVIPQTPAINPLPAVETTVLPGRETILRPVYETVPRMVTETVYKPVCETVMKECRSTVTEKVCETHYKECSVRVCKEVQETVQMNRAFQVSKPVCETVYKDFSRMVCKPVTETHYRECTQTVCKPLTETVFRETSRTVMREVSETVYQEVRKPINETVTCMHTVVKLVPETVTETVCVPGCLVWKSVPKYECSFDPCTCSSCQKQVGTTRKLVHEPSHTITRQVTRDKTVVEQVPETKVIQKTAVEKVPTTVTKKVATVICERVPVTVTRNIQTQETVKVPYTVTRNVPTVEVTRVPVTVHRRILGAYVDVASLTKEAAAEAAKGVDFLPGGPEVLCIPNPTTYEISDSGRVFVEGIQGRRSFTFCITKSIPTIEIRKVPYQVTKMVTKEVTKMVPTPVTRMVPTTVAKVVPVPTCRIVRDEVVKTPCPEVCRKCPEVILTRECASATSTPVTPAPNPRGPITGTPCTACNTCGPVCPSTAASTSGCPFGCSVFGSWLHKIYNNPQRLYPFRDFFCRRHAKSITCSDCQPQVPCATPSTPLPPIPEKAPASGPPKTLPPISQ